MEDKQFTPRQPDYKSNEGVAVWKAIDKNGNTYLNVRVLGNNIACFKNEARPTPTQDKTI